MRPATGAMEKLRRVLSGQDDEEQGLTSQVACPRRRQAEGANVCWARGAGQLPGRAWGAFQVSVESPGAPLETPDPFGLLAEEPALLAGFPPANSPCAPRASLAASPGASAPAAGRARPVPRGWGAGPSPATCGEPKPLRVSGLPVPLGINEALRRCVCLLEMGTLELKNPGH